VAAFHELVARLRAVRPAVLHSFLFHANLAGRVAGRLAGVPRVISSVRVCEVDRPWRAALDRLTQRWMDLETCVAGAVRDYTRRAAGIPDRKLAVIHNGVEIPDGAPTAGRAPGRRVLTVAHLRPQKGIPDLLRAAPGVLAAHPDATFTIVGGGDVDAYRRMAAAAGMGGAVTFAGETADAGPHFRSADLFVLPSRWEGCPNAVLEAMAAGLPVVATTVGGTPELVVDGETGRLAPPGSPGMLAVAIRELLADPVRARAMGEAGRRRVAESFSVARMVREHEALYERLAVGAVA
jgi:glycosyltransferase involved in cell wall biosynthesis